MIYFNSKNYNKGFTFLLVCVEAYVSVNNFSEGFHVKGICNIFIKHFQLQIDYPLNIYISYLGENVGEAHKKAADLGSTYQWPELLEFLKTRETLVNSCRLPVGKSSCVDLCTPLHYAAKGGAPKDVFEELVKLGASKTLKNSSRETAYDVGKKNGLSEEILKVIDVPQDLLEKETEIEKMESGLHKVILGRAKTAITESGQQLPQVAFLYEFGDLWYPVSGMYGGFHISTHDKGIQSVSFCRVVGGSGQRHVIDRQGKAKLVEEGFY